MSYKSKFKYNEAYDNSDIAEALSIITGEGVAVSTPSEILSEYASGGVTYADERLNVTLSNTTVTVGCGAAIWSDGSYIVVYEPEKFQVSLSGTYYVYLKYNNVGDISVKCATTLPSTNYMLLAQIDNGVLSDKRTYATSKVGNYGQSSLNELTRTAHSNKQATYTLPNYGYSLIILTYAGEKTAYKHPVIYNKNTSSFLNNCAYFYISTGTTDKCVTGISISDNTLTVTLNANIFDDITVYCI